MTKKCFAAKHIKTRWRADNKRVGEEIGILKKLSDQHIISFIGAYKLPGEVVVIMEYLEGGDLFQKVVDEDFTLTEAHCCFYLRQICLGLKYLHNQSIVHLDLKVGKD